MIVAATEMWTDRRTFPDKKKRCEPRISWRWIQVTLNTSPVFSLCSHKRLNSTACIYFGCLAKKMSTLFWPFNWFFRVASWVEQRRGYRVCFGSLLFPSFPQLSWQLDTFKKYFSPETQPVLSEVPKMIWLLRWSKKLVCVWPVGGFGRCNDA